MQIIPPVSHIAALHCEVLSTASYTVQAVALLEEKTGMM